MTDQELLEKIEKVSNGDWKRKDFIKNCVGYVIDNFNDIEPIIKKHWLDKERAKLDIPTLFPYSQTCYSKNYTMQYGNTAEYVDSATGKCKDKEDKEKNE